jgi:hypothetical protein
MTLKHDPVTSSGKSTSGPDPRIRHRIQIDMFRSIRVDHTNCLQVAIKTHSFIRLVGKSNCLTPKELGNEVFPHKVSHFDTLYKRSSRKNRCPNVSVILEKEEIFVGHYNLCAENLS